MLAPLSVSVPVPDTCSAPDAPEMRPEYESLSERLKMRVPEFTTLDVAIEPVVEPEPTLTAPAEIVNAPVKVFAPDKVSVPEPCFVSLPLLPEMMPANVVSELPAVVSVFVGEPVVLS